MKPENQAALTGLLRRVGTGDPDALTELHHKTRTWLARAIQRIVKDPGHAEEVLQDVFTYIWLHASEYRGERGTPSAWLGMLARSRALDRFRTTRRDLLSANFNDAVRAAPLNPVDVWRNSRLHAALLDLCSSQRHLIHLAFFEGMTHSEIAERTGMPLGTVKTRIRGSLTDLRKRMASEEEFGRAA